MKPAGAKAKGRYWENKIVEFLRGAGWPYTERRRLTGSRDQGDIAGIPGVVIEAKAANAYTLAAWMQETETERRNANASVAACWIKRVGHGAAEAGYVLMTPQVFLHLLRTAGYGGVDGKIRSPGLQQDPDDPGERFTPTIE